LGLWLARRPDRARCTFQRRPEPGMRRLLSGDRRCKPLQGSANHDHRPLHPHLPDCIEPEVGPLPGGQRGGPRTTSKWPASPSSGRSWFGWRCDGKNALGQHALRHTYAFVQGQAGVTMEEVINAEMLCAIAASSPLPQPRLRCGRSRIWSPTYRYTNPA
jgi:hypothetical protein